jgi:hypothetical protein
VTTTVSSLLYIRDRKVGQVTQISQHFPIDFSPLSDFDMFKQEISGTTKTMSGSVMVEIEGFLKTVLRIQDILVRIWIRGSRPLTNGSGSGYGSCYFRHWPSRLQQKTNLKKSFSAYYFLKKIHLHHFSKS